MPKEEVDVDVAPMPSSLAGVAPPPEPEETEDDVEEEDEPEDDDEDDSEEDDESTEGKLDDLELASMCGDLYGDLFNAAAHYWAGTDYTLPETRTQKRGRQWAFALRKLGWADDEIILGLGLAAGVASDVAFLRSLKAQSTSTKTKQEPPVEKPE